MCGLWMGYILNIKNIDAAWSHAWLMSAKMWFIFALAAGLKSPERNSYLAENYKKIKTYFKSNSEELYFRISFFLLSTNRWIERNLEIFLKLKISALNLSLKFRVALFVAAANPQINILKK
jgi:hypothetical protein